MRPSKAISLLAALLSACVVSNAKCAVDIVAVKGRVENAPPNTKVRVQLLYHRNRTGESGETTLQGTQFSIPVNFYTLSRRGILGEWLERCERIPKAVAVTLTDAGGSKEYDRVTLKLLSDFNEPEPGSYVSKSEVVLRAPN
jgi:hypothetical protein